MKVFSLYFLICLFFFSLQAHALNLHGFVFISDGQYYFTDSDTRKSYLLNPANEEARVALSKLKSLDNLIGNGSLGPYNTVYLESVDFVSLRRLIGVWKSPQALVDFVDYTRVAFHVQSEKKSNEYTYALSPADGNNWRIFFNDTSSVVLGSLTMQNSKVQIEMYDPNTGEVSQHFDLQKINP